MTEKKVPFGQRPIGIRVRDRFLVAVLGASAVLGGGLGILTKEPATPASLATTATAQHLTTLEQQKKALYAAIYAQDRAQVSALLGNGALTRHATFGEAQEALGYALNISVAIGANQITSDLLNKYGADPNFHGATPLILAAERNNVEAMTLLKAQGGDINTAFLNAYDANDIGTLNRLLGQGVQLDNYGADMLYEATMDRNLPMVQFLIGNGVPADNNSFMNTVFAGDTLAAEFLLRNGANAALDDNLPLLIAVRGDDVEMALLLRAYGAPSTPDMLKYAQGKPEMERALTAPPSPPISAPHMPYPPSPF